MIVKTLTRCFMVACVGVMYGCTSPLHKGLDLGDPAPISKAPPPAAVPKGDGLTIKARPLKRTVELGEPVYLALTVVNEGKEPVKIVGGLRPGEGLVEIYSTDAEGKQVNLHPIGDGDFEGTVVLAPGRTIGDVLPIFFGSNGWSFTRTGEYRVSAELRVPAKEGFSAFSSEPVIINVKSSEAGQSLFSGEKRSSAEAGKYLLWRSGDHLVAGVELLASLSKRYPESALSSYIAAAHVRNYSEPFANYEKGSVRKADCEKADSFRKMVNKDVLTTNLVIEDYISQARCHAENKKWEAAAVALDRGAKLSAEKPEFAAYYQAISEMQKRLSEFRVE